MPTKGEHAAAGLGHADGSEPSLRSTALSGRRARPLMVGTGFHDAPTTSAGPRHCAAAGPYRNPARRHCVSTAPTRACQRSSAPILAPLSHPPR